MRSCEPAAQHCAVEADLADEVSLSVAMEEIDVALRRHRPLGEQRLSRLKRGH